MMHQCIRINADPVVWCLGDLSQTKHGKARAGVQQFSSRRHLFRPQRSNFRGRCLNARYCCCLGYRHRSLHAPRCRTTFEGESLRSSMHRPGSSLLYFLYDVDGLPQCLRWKLPSLARQLSPGYRMQPWHVSSVLVTQGCSAHFQVSDDPPYCLARKHGIPVHPGGWKSFPPWLVRAEHARGSYECAEPRDAASAICLAAALEFWPFLFLEHGGWLSESGVSGCKRANCK